MFSLHVLFSVVGALVVLGRTQAFKMDTIKKEVGFGEEVKESLTIINFK